MKNLSQMVSRLVLATFLVATSFTIGEAKPNKIVKGITFTGEVVKGMPHGYGTLVITNKSRGVVQNFMEITGSFDNGNISNGKIDYCMGLNTNYGSEFGGLLSDKLSTNVIEGDFSYSVTDKWGKITINISSATIHGVKTINLGSIKLEHDSSIPRCEFNRDNKSSGELYLPMPKNNLNDIILLVGHNPSESYLTNYSYTLGRYGSSSLLKITVDNKNILKFSDGSILEYNTNEGKYCSAKGDIVNFVRSNYNTPPYELREFTITDSQGNIYKGKGSGGWVGKNELKLNILYSDGSKFDGMVMTDFLDKEHVGLEIFTKMKEFTKSSIKYYKGTYTEVGGETISYINGRAKINNIAILPLAGSNQNTPKINEQAANIDFSLLGIPIKGNVTAYNARLKQEGCVYKGQYANFNAYEFEGKVLEQKASINVYYDECTKLVYKVKARIFSNSKEDWKYAEKIADMKYKVAVDNSRSNPSGYSPYKTYTNGKYTLVLDLDHNPNGTCYVNFTYINEENLLKKFQSDLKLPSLNLNKNGFLAAYRNRGKVLKHDYDNTYDLDLNGLKAKIEIDCDGNGKIDRVIFKCYLAGSKDESDTRDYASILKTALDKIYPEARKDELEDRWFLDDMQITAYERDHMFTVCFIKVKASRPGGDI